MTMAAGHVKGVTKTGGQTGPLWGLRNLNIARLSKSEFLGSPHLGDYPVTETVHFTVTFHKLMQYKEKDAIICMRER